MHALVHDMCVIVAFSTAGAAAAAHGRVDLVAVCATGMALVFRKSARFLSRLNFGQRVTTRAAVSDAQQLIDVACNDPTALLVGAGWSYTLRKKSPQLRVLFTHGVRGPALEYGADWWWAGTSIGEVQRALTLRGRTLASHPSILETTLGGWIASGAHGSGGTLWTPQFGGIAVVSRAERTERRGRKSEFFPPDATHAERAHFLVLAVQVRDVPNVWCRKRAVRLRDRKDFEALLDQPTHLQMLFVGARGTMGLTWTTLDDTAAERISHVDPHLGSQLRLWFQSDVLSIFQEKRHDAPWFSFPVEPAKNFDSRVRLADANDFTPVPLHALSFISLLYLNFELLLDVHTTPALLMDVCSALTVVLASGKCRVEIRWSTNALLLDVVCLQGWPLRPMFAALRDAFDAHGIPRLISGRQHRGKFHVVDTAPLMLDGDRYASRKRGEES